MNTKQEAAMRQALEAVYETIIQWDEGGGKRSRRELARRITALYTRPQARDPLTVDEVEQILARWNYELHGDRVRFIVRETEAAHGIKGKQDE